jgi:NADH-quinone oxidoreductase subunit L
VIDTISQNAHLVVPWLILLLPLGGFTVLALFGDGIKRDKEESGAAILACATVLGSFALSVWAVVSMLHTQAGDGGLRFAQPVLGKQGTMAEGLAWIEAGAFRIPFSLLLDPLSAVMILTVTGVGALIHIYSLGYMAHDEERVQYFSYLNLFTFFMLLLVLGGSLPLLFVGWEGVGLCSYLLIGFWFKKKTASDAGKKAFIVNRIGDVGLILGMILAFQAWGTLDLVELAEHAASIPREAMGVFGSLTVVCLLLFVGATGKSAQIPLHVWLPDAMEGPTPVSALIHAATMVTAGVYLVARLSPLFARSETALAVVASIGAATALMAATVALVQTDIKRVLAYSTVSQLGYMFLACGVGAYGVGVFHLFTHAFFKALLFLGSGSVIHAMSGEQDMRKMGGLLRKIPWTFGTFLVGTLAIAGIPPLAGFFSKDEILGATLSGGRTWLFAIGLFTALLTAFYMSRLLFMTFFGSFRGDHEAEHHLHESPWTMLAPLCLLALGSASAGFIRIPEFVAPAVRLTEHEGAEHSWLLPALATVTALAGIVSAFYLYVIYLGVPEKIASRFRPLYRLLDAKYYVDDAYNWFASRVVVDGSSGFLWKRFDVGLIDGIVNGAASVTDAVSKRVRFVQTGLVRGYALVILGGAVALLGYLLWHA